MKRVVVFSWIALLFLCGLASILAAEKERNSEVSVGVGSSPAGKEQLDFHNTRTIRQLPAVDSSASSSFSSGWIEPLFRRTAWNEESSPLSYRDNELKNDDGLSDSSSEYWQENEDVPSANQAADVTNIDQLNWRDSQLARLHGLGPAEIAALSSWQNRLRLHSLPKRITERVPPNQDQEQEQEKIKSSSSPRNFPWISTDATLLPRVLTPQHRLGGNDDKLETGLSDAERQTNLTRDNTINEQDVLQLWPKRSSNPNKIDKENNSKTRNASSRKEKSEQNNGATIGSGNKGGGKGKGSNRKQQQVKQESSHRHISEENVGIGADGVHEQQQHSKSSQGSSNQAADVSRLNRNLATQFLLRSPRENRQYDVPIIGE